MPDSAITPAYLEHMMAMARTQILSPRAPIAFNEASLKMARLSLVNGTVGMRLMDTVASRDVGVYTIMGTTGANAFDSKSCGSEEVSMVGMWSIRDSDDGFLGLQRAGLVLSEDVNTEEAGDGLVMVASMESARDRWQVQQVGDGSIKIANRATGNVLTQSGRGCTFAAADTGAAAQHWLLGSAH